MNLLATRKDTGWPSFVADVLAYNGWDNTVLAARGGFDRSMVGRWLSGEVRPTIDKIRQVCRAAGVDIREGLIAAGYFTEDELHYTPNHEPDMSLISDEKLLAEMRKRMRRHQKPALSEVTEYTTSEQDGQAAGSYRVSESGGATLRSCAAPSTGD